MKDDAALAFFLPISYKMSVVDRCLLEPRSQLPRVLQVLGPVGHQSPPSIDPNIFSVQPLVLDQVHDGVHDLVRRHGGSRESGVGGEVVLEVCGETGGEARDDDRGRDRANSDSRRSEEVGEAYRSHTKDTSVFLLSSSKAHANVRTYFESFPKQQLW